MPARVARSAQIAKNKTMAKTIKRLLEENKKLKSQREETEKKLKNTTQELATTRQDLLETRIAFEEAMETMKTVVEETDAMRQEAVEIEKKIENQGKVLGKALKEEAEKTNWFRRRMEELEAQRESPSEAAVPSTPIAYCEICCLDYSEHPDRTPRVFDCGHSVCTACCGSLRTRDGFRCPFDRETTKLKEFHVALPKNFTILAMMRPDY